MLIKYQNSLQEKVLLIIYKAISHVSSESLDNLKNNKIYFLIIPPGATSFTATFRLVYKQYI